MQTVTPTVQVTVTVTDPSAEETPRRFSQAELEDMVRRWDFDENEWACRDLLIAAFPPGGQPLLPGGTGGDAHHGPSGGDCTA